MRTSSFYNYETEIKELMEGWTAFPKSHAQWLNTLSFLEYIGCRKIVKSQDAQVINSEILQHIAEEARHASFFKKEAEKINCRPMGYSAKEMIAGEAAEDYFQQLDRAVEEKLKGASKDPRFLNYLYVTWLVETRATQVYEIYQSILEKKNFDFSLKSLLREEQRHLDEMTEWIQQLDPQKATNWREFIEMEKKQFGILLEQLKKSAQTLAKSGEVSPV